MTTYQAGSTSQTNSRGGVLGTRVNSTLLDSKPLTHDGVTVDFAPNHVGALPWL